MASDVPLTVIASLQKGDQLGAAIGKTHHGPQFEPNAYWYLVVNRSDLSNTPVNMVSKSNNEIPAEVAKFVDDSQYMLVVATMALTTPNLPQGSLRTLLAKLGGVDDLNRLEQVYNQYGCGQLARAAFALASVLGDSETGFSTGCFSSLDRRILTLTLRSAEIEGKTLYSPVADTTHTYTPAS